MSKSLKSNIARCECGSVEFTVIGKPVLSIACHCDDCQQGSLKIEQLPNAPHILDQAGGTTYLLYRKDRMNCSKGAEHLRDCMLKDDSPTRRTIATCCNSFMFLDFKKGHWFSMHRAQFEGNAPALQMRIQTKFKPEGSNVPNGASIYSTFPFKFIGKLMAARVAMLLRL